MAEIYPIEKNIKSVKERIENAGFPDIVKRKIMEFVQILTEGSCIKEHRQYYYYERLLILCEAFGERILDSKGHVNPNRNDVLEVIRDLREKVTVRGTQYSPSTISDFKKTLKKFVKYCRENEEKEEDRELPGFWKDIHSQKINSRYSSADQMISYEELRLLVESSKNPRDKALFSLLWDSGIRASELLKLKVKDFERSTDGLYAILNIQEGSKNHKQRSVVLTGDSVILVSEYIDYLKGLLKDSFRTEGYLFVGIGKENFNRNLTYADLRTMIQKVRVRSGLKKQITPHLFRHSAATRMGVDVPIQVFTKQMGWSSNKMADNYVHLSNKDQIKAILKSSGIPVTEEELEKPLSEVNRKCPRCHTVNMGSSRFCSNCGSPMKQSDFIKIEEERNTVLETLRNTNMISSELMATMDSLPEDSKTDILASILLRFEKDGTLNKLKKILKE